ncbi:tandem-type lipoprotein [Listeria grayi]|uniref:tandem-type lipoprotein n=1 Tax=Listeria grayi TaxID=1641 RepID=UPI00162705CC|nr:tandem-type lipoprotein [Listeria grayi]MBC1921184.1 tandem-type lipoprotein [Listeria grayi]
MKKKIVISILIGGVTIMSLLGGCGESSTNEKAKKTEQSFEKVLAMYPTKNLEAFYDMEGYRDDEFEKGDKGVWVLNSEMSISTSKKDPLHTEGMLLRINRNTHTAKGYYYLDTTNEEKLDENNEKKYPVTYDKNGFHLVKAVSDPKLREKIENFQFFVQYGEFKQLNQYKNIDKMYNPEVPMYELEYQLTNDDPNVKQLRKRYEIPTDKEPTLVLNGRGELDGSSISSKELTFQFSKNPAIFLIDSIDYQPFNAEDDQ